MDQESMMIMRSNSGLTSANKNGNKNIVERPRVVHVPLLVCLLILSSYVLLGGLLFSKWNHKWSLLDASFFAFLSLTTVGVSPTSSSTGEAIFSPSGSLFQGSHKRIFGLTLYLLLGFALVSMSLHLVYEDVVRRVRRLGRKMTACCGFVSGKRTPDEESKDLSVSHHQDQINVDVRNAYDMEMEGS
jgi:hypothetical protein